jgi:hypothetical protein
VGINKEFLMTRILIRSKGNNSLFMNLTRDAVSVSADTPYLLENYPNVSDCKLLATKAYKALIEVCSDDDNIIKTYSKNMPMIKVTSIDDYIKVKEDVVPTSIVESAGESKIETFQNDETTSEVNNESTENESDKGSGVSDEDLDSEIKDDSEEIQGGIFKKKRGRPAKEN